MKIVLVIAPGIFAEQIKKAFLNNGQEIYYFNDREIKIFPIFKNSIYLWRFIKKFTVLKKINNKLVNQSLINLCRQTKPDLLFVNKGMIINQQTLMEIKKMGIKTANWFQENTYQEVYLNWLSNNYKNYDYLFTNDSEIFKKFYNKSLTKLCNVSMTIDPDYYKILPLSEEEVVKYSCDVCFVGAFDQRREKILSKINEIKDINLKIFGWEGWGKSILAPLYHGPLNIEQMAKLYHYAKICLNINGQSLSTDPVTNGVNLKTFEIPASGGFQLSDYRKDMDDMFKIGEEIAIYKNEDELLEKIKFYLDHEEARMKIIEAGHKKVLESHTLIARVKDMLSFIKNN